MARNHTCACLLTVLCLTATGCSFPPRQSHSPVAYAPNDGRPTIVCLGDSLTAGDAAPSDHSYPAWLQKRLDTLGYRYRVINAGVSGDRVLDGLMRLDSDVLAFHPAITTVGLGSNDPGHTTSLSWATELTEVIRRLRAKGSKVVLAGLDERGMTEVYRSVATRNNVPLAWMTTGLWSRPGLWGDAHHPNGAGYRVVMQNVWQALLGLLRR